MHNRANPAPVILAFLISCLSIASGQNAAGIYAYSDFRNDPDSKAKVAQFLAVKQAQAAYHFQSFSGRWIKVDPAKYLGAVYYPSSKTGVSIDKQKKKLEELKAFAKKFPASGGYLSPRIVKLSSNIQQIEKWAKEQKSLQRSDSSKIAVLTLKNGKIYKGVTIRKKLPDAIKILHQGGAATIPYEDLPALLSDKLGGFDPEEAKEYRITDKERWKVEEGKLRKEMANDEQAMVQNDIVIKKRLEKRLGNLVRPFRPAHGQIDRITRGRILNVFKDGILISVGRSGVCKVEMDSTKFVDDDIVSDILERTERRYKYTAVSGALKTVPVYVPVSREVRNYLVSKDEYDDAKSSIEKELRDLNYAPSKRAGERESLLSSKKKAFMKLRARQKSER